MKKVTREEFLRALAAEERGKGERSRSKPTTAGSRGSSSWRCGDCGEVLTGSSERAERHMHEKHGGGRLELVLDPGL